SPFLQRDRGEAAREEATLRLLADVGERFYTSRLSAMRKRQEGLTAICNRISDPSESDSDICHLRDLIIELDTKVIRSYGWGDVCLQHGYTDVGYGRRFAFGESVRSEILARLLQLNHQRYADEVRQGLHRGKASKPTSRKKTEISSEPEPS